MKRAATSDHASTIETARPLWRPLLFVLLAVAPIIAITQAAAHATGGIVDDHAYGYVGWRLAHGARMYLDVWGNKPPLVYWINGIATLLAGGSYAGPIVACVLAVFTAHALLFVCAASVYYRGSAILLTILASIYLTHPLFESGSNRTETYLIVFELAAVAVYLRAAAPILNQERRSWRRWILAGALAGCALLCKQAGLAAFTAMLVHTFALAAARRVTCPVALKRCGLLAAGLVVPVIVAAVLLAARSALGEAWFAAVTFNRGYFAVGSASFTDLYVDLYFLTDQMLAVLQLPLLMAAAAIIHAAARLFHRVPAPSPSHDPPAAGQFPLLLFTIWFLAALYAAGVSPDRLPHYLIPTVPPLLLAAGGLLHALQRERNLSRRVAVSAWTTAALVAIVGFAGPALRMQFEVVSRVVWERKPTFNDDAWLPTLEPTPWEIVGSRVAAHSRPDETMYCWGYFPGVYLHARRPNAARFFTYEKTWHVGRHADFIRRELHRVFQDAPPAVFVVTPADLDRMQGTGPEQRPPDWLERWLGAWLPQHYRIVEEVGGQWPFVILRRADLPPITPDTPQSSTRRYTARPAGRS